MGLLDVLNGMQNAQGGQPTPATAGASGGMSPIMKAMLATLAFKVVKSFMENQAGAAPARSGAPSGTTSRKVLARLVDLTIYLRVDWVVCWQAVPPVAY